MQNFKNFIFEQKDNFVNEAISGKNMEKALGLILKYLNTKIGPLYQLPGLETIKKSDGIFFGIHYINDAGKSIRINWSSKGGAQDSKNIHSVDFFHAEQMFGAPNLTLELNGESMARVLPAVVEMFKSMSIVDVDGFVTETLSFSDLEKPNLLEYRTKGAVGKKTAAKAKVGDKKSKNISKEILDAEDLLDDTPWADPDTIFDDMAAYVQMVTSGIQKSLIICGSPGIGKCLGFDNLVEIETVSEIF